MTTVIGYLYIFSMFMQPWVLYSRSSAAENYIYQTYQKKSKYYFHIFISRYFKRYLIICWRLSKQHKHSFQKVMCHMLTAEPSRLLFLKIVSISSGSIHLVIISILIIVQLPIFINMDFRPEIKIINSVSIMCYPVCCNLASIAIILLCYNVTYSRNYKDIFEKKNGWFSRQYSTFSWVFVCWGCNSLTIQWMEG